MLKTHTKFIINIKPLKKIFRKGKMMKTFEYINTLYHMNNLKAIERIQIELFDNRPKFHQGNYNKYNDLILYCQYLLLVRHLNKESRLDYGNEIINKLDKVHELGISIEKEILMISLF